MLFEKYIPVIDAAPQHFLLQSFFKDFDYGYDFHCLGCLSFICSNIVFTKVIDEILEYNNILGQTIRPVVNMSFAIITSDISSLRCCIRI